jgi:hypothetical protein
MFHSLLRAASTSLLIFGLSATLVAQKSAPSYQPTLASLDKHPLPDWYGDVSSACSCTGACTPYPAGRP